MEIERKFKLKNLPIEINNCEKKEIEQGYLCIKPTVRIRKNGSNYSLNYKWKDKNCIESKAIQNIEYEMYLTEENYNILRKKVENNMIVKTRYKVPLKDGLIAEIDIFHENLFNQIGWEKIFLLIKDMIILYYQKLKNIVKIFLNNKENVYK